MFGQLKTQIAKLGNPEVRGDNAVRQFNYEEAAYFYQKAIDIDPGNYKLYLKLAESYRNESRYSEALTWYAKVMENPEVEVGNIYKLRYAESLLAMNQIPEARYWYEEHHRLDTMTMTENRLEGLENFDQFFESKGTVNVNKIAINSLQRDYSPTYFKRGIIFVSERPHQLLHKDSRKKKVAVSKTNYSNLYFSARRAEGNWDEPHMLGASINTDFHEGPLSIYNDEQNMAFTRNNYLKRRVDKSNTGQNMLQIYFAKQNKHHSWGEMGPFEHNNPNYSSGHPAMNEGGDLMVFVSNMPGGFGEGDLYYSKREADSTWSKPVNLGDEINTEGQELFPNIEGSVLYFASNGHPGMGGLDVYRTTFSIDEIGEIVNLGIPINSHADDFGYVADETGNKGYFTSNREDPLNDEIYEFGLVNINARISVIDSRTKDELSEAKVSMVLSENETKSWNYKGNKIRLTSVLNREHKVSLQAPNYFSRETTVETGVDKPNETREFVLKMKRKPKLEEDSVQIIINGEQIFLAFNQNVYTPNYGQDVVISDGRHELSLGFGLNKSEQMKLPSMLIKKGYKVKQPLVVDNIYYATNYFELRPQDKFILDEFIEVMLAFDELNLFVNSHADSRGSKEYNLQLSQKRARAAYDYLVTNGIDRSRLKMLYFGEHVPENECIDGVNCAEEDYQQNRKSEFGFFVIRESF
ncbi:MAG: OmpA family protein [Reichenbachiella sp.]